MAPLRPHEGDDIPPEPVEKAIIRRGSTRRFSRESITFAELSTILQAALHAVPADFLEPPSGSLNDVYVIANQVEDLAPGAYYLHRSRRELELLKQGEFRRVAGRLGLDQALPADASVNIFLLADLRRVLDRYGNRGYRAAQLEASIAAGRVYLAAYALPRPLGATGLTFYDDAVTDFFSPHATGKSVMFMVAVGKKARRG